MNREREAAVSPAEFQKLLPSMMDLSCVRAHNTREELEQMAQMARRISCAAVFAMPANTPYLIELMKGSGITVGGVVGFPSGCDTTETKVFTAARLLEMGCGELDMVINQSALRSGMDDLVAEDLTAVIRGAGSVPVKVILEVTNLSPEEITRGSKLAAAAGAAFVKTGTGWNTAPTQPCHVRLIREALGDSVRIKAAGGIRDLTTAYELYRLGCTRFGVGTASAEGLLKSI